MSKATYLVGIYRQTVAELTKNKEQWKSLLEVMARYYKYSFDNNVLICAQRPNAGLLADRDVWNQKIGRYINKGAKGIAVINMNNPTATLKYLFDLMDTNGDNESFLRVLSFVWQLENQYKPGLIKAFGELYGTNTASMGTCLYDLVGKRIDSQLPQYMENFRITDKDSILYGLPIDAVKDQYIKLVRDSVSFLVFKRCGLATDIFEDNDCFENINHFNSLDLFMRMGCATMSIARPSCVKSIRKSKISSTKGAINMKTKPLINLDYNEGEDGLMYPNIQMSENPVYDSMEIGKYGQIWKEYMTEQHPHRLSQLIAEGKINQMIVSVDKEADNRKEILIQQLLKAQPLPQTEDTMERAVHLEMIYHTAEEIILNEIVFKPR